MLAAFRESILTEIVQELSFLYDYRNGALEDVTFSLADVAEIEERMETHLDALLVGGDQAMKLCERQVQEGDVGELHAAVRLFCRTDRSDLVLEAAKSIDWEEKEQRQAYTDALKHELPASWQTLVERWLEEADAGLAAALAEVVGFRRLDLGAAIGKRIQREAPATVAPYLWSLGQLNEPSARMLFYRYVQQPDHEVGRTAALGALRLGIAQAPGYVQNRSSTYSWTPIPVAVSGGRGTAGLLASMAQKTGSAEAVLALGVLGDADSFELLHSLLSSAELADSAAVALHLLTGADLFEDVELPIRGLEVDSQDDTETELQLGEPSAEENESPDAAEQEAAGEDNGSGPTTDEATGDESDDPPLVETVRRISQCPNTWASWWRANQGRFRGGIRYRLGEPVSPEVLLGSLAATILPLRVRQWLADEIMIRHAIDVPYAPDMLVASQTRAFAAARMAMTAAADQQRSRVGSWWLRNQAV